LLGDKTTHGNNTMIKNLIGVFTLLFVNVVHADKNLDVLQDGIYYIQDYIRPKKIVIMNIFCHTGLSLQMNFILRSKKTR
jgi:hypothetical protein